jgi:hypothetical protein
MLKNNIAGLGEIDQAVQHAIFCVAQNRKKIMKEVEKIEPSTDCFTQLQLVQKTMNTRTQYMSANITLKPQEQF